MKALRFHTELSDHLRTIRHCEPVYIPNSGNAGDSFIACSTYQLLSDLEIEFELGCLTEEYPGRTLIIGGGGNLVEPYPNVVQFIRKNMNKWKQLIVLPHSIRSYSGVLRELEQNTIIHCRERASYEYVRSVGGKANVFLSHDMALSCDLLRVRDEYRQVAWVNRVRSRVALRDTKRLVRSLWYRISHGYSETLNIIRSDVEKTGIKLPDGNFDISSKFSADDMTSVSSLHATYGMMSFIDQFDVIKTNRLHAGIMAALLGKNVTLYDNSYGKIRDVFNHSIKGRYSNVAFAEYDFGKVK